MRQRAIGCGAAKQPSCAAGKAVDRKPSAVAIFGAKQGAPLRFSRLICGLLGLAALWLAPASAMEIKCIEASRYKHLYWIFGDDPQKLAAYLGVDTSRYPLPGRDLCRAAVLSGDVGYEKGRPKDDVSMLLSFVIQNRGWLATIYLDSGGGDTGTGWRLGTVLRSFRLKTRVSKDYDPDFGLAALRPSGDLPGSAPARTAAGKCSLKDAVPDRTAAKGAISGIVRAAGADSTYEPDHWRQGDAYREFDVARADPNLCQKACVDESRCAGWNYRKPEGRTNGRPHCWLLERTSSRNQDGMMIGGVVTRPGAASFEEDTVRNGRDYRQVEVPIPDPKLCQRQCIDDLRCRAWSYAAPPPADLLAFMSNWEGYRKLQQALPAHGGDWCASSCSNMFIGGVDRIGRVHVHRANRGFVETQYGNDDRAFAAYFRYMDPGPQFVRTTLSTSGQSIAFAPVARFPRYNIDYVIANCRGDPEVLQGVEAELELAISKLGSPKLGVPIKVDHLQSSLAATHEQRRAVEQCVTRALEHDRLVAFERLCGKDCDAGKLHEQLGAELKRVTDSK